MYFYIRTVFVISLTEVYFKHLIMIRYKKFTDKFAGGSFIIISNSIRAFVLDYRTPKNNFSSIPTAARIPQFNGKISQPIHLLIPSCNFLSLLKAFTRTGTIKKHNDWVRPNCSVLVSWKSEKWMYFCVMFFFEMMYSYEYK